MSTAMKIRSDELQFASQMNSYINSLKEEARNNPVIAKSNAKKALVRTGVLTTKGNVKKKIVSWE